MKEVSPTSKSSTEQETFCLLVARFSSSKSTHSAEWWWWWAGREWKLESLKSKLCSSRDELRQAIANPNHVTIDQLLCLVLLCLFDEQTSLGEMNSKVPHKRETNRRSSARIKVMKWEIFGVRMKLSDNVRLFVANRNLPPPLLAEMKSFPITVFHVWLPLAHREKSRVEVSMRDGKMHRTGNECN